MKASPCYCLLFCLIFLCCHSARASSVVVTGDVSGTWSVDTVFVADHIQVPGGQTLTIAPGTYVQFQSYFRLNVLGNMVALGNLADSIVFTIRDTSNFYSQTSGRGGWSGIRFENTDAGSDSSLFAFCRFEYGKATEDSTNSYGGAFFIKNFGKIRISNCLFYHNYSYYSGGAIYLRFSDVKVEYCRFEDNYSGNTGTVYGYGGGLCSLNSSPVINRNEFYYNSSTGVGGAASFDHSDPEFSQNCMSYNFSALGGAIGILRSSPSHTLSNNLVTYNSSLFFGGGICCIRSFPVFSNLTISGNSSSYGGGFYCNDSASPRTYNSIIYGNTGFGSSVYIWDVFSAPSFYYCDIEGDSSGFQGSGGQQGYHGEYMDNIDAEPSYYGLGDFPFQLVAGSACINSGTPDPGFLSLPELDVAGAPRVWNSRIDMGCYEFNGTTGTVPVASQPCSFDVYPNPFRDHFTIRLSEAAEKPFVLELFDCSGRILDTITIDKGHTHFVWNAAGQQLTPGNYLLRRKAPNRVVSRCISRIN